MDIVCKLVIRILEIHRIFCVLLGQKMFTFFQKKFQTYSLGLNKIYFYFLSKLYTFRY